MMFACVKQNTTVKAAIDACSLITKQTSSDLVWEPVSSLIINFEQVIRPFLVFNIYFTFFYQWLIALFARVLLRVTVYYYYVT